MTRDRSGNSLGTARKLTLNPNARLVRDFVGTGDRNDLYRFTLTNRSRFDLKLTNIGRGANVDVQLYSLKRVRQAVLRSIGKIDFSKLPTRFLRQNLFRVISSNRGGRKNEAIDFTLEPGEYYIRVVQRRGDTRYSLSLSATPNASTTLDIGSPSNGTSVGTPGSSTSGNTASGSTASSGNTSSSNTSNSPSGNHTPPVLSPPVFSQNWVRQFGTIGNDYAYGVATNGNTVYVSGSVPNATDVSKTRAYVNRYSSDSNGFAFANPSGSTNFRLLNEVILSRQSAIASDVAVDAAGNFYVVGANRLTATSSDGFVAKYNNSGQLLWRKTISSTVAGIRAGDAASSVAVDAQGNVYIAGFTELLPTSGANQGQAFVAKYSPGGRQRWLKKYGDSQTDVASGVAVDSVGNVYITGITDATLGGNANDLQSLSGGTTFLAKFSGTNGSQLWAQRFGDPSNPFDNNARGIAIDSADNIYITGDTKGLLDAGQTYAGETDGYLAKYNTSGTQVWIRQFGTAGIDESQGIAVDASGRVYLTGETNGSLFGNTPLGGSDAWLAEFDSAGNIKRSHLIGTALDDEAYGIAVSPLDPASNPYQVYIAGQTRSALEETNQGQYDAWIGQYS